MQLNLRFSNIMPNISFTVSLLRRFVLGPDSLCAPGTMTTGNPDRTRALGRHRYGLEDNIKMNLKQKFLGRTSSILYSDMSLTA
jgi:hypothetical protein